MTDWGDPQTFWLNLTNAALGVATIVPILVVTAVAVVEAGTRLRAKLPVRHSRVPRPQPG